jgi:hypothetical protein
VQETILRAIYATCAADISRAAFSGLLFLLQSRDASTEMRASLCRVPCIFSGKGEELSLFRPVDRQMRR